jgi:hypothetical protein
VIWTVRAFLVDAAHHLTTRSWRDGAQRAAMKGAPYGRFGEPIPGTTLKVNLENIRLDAPTPGVMEGEPGQFWANGGGSARVVARLDGVTRELGGPPTMTTPLRRP